jgi:putative mRNA 3-end processing factor
MAYVTRSSLPPEVERAAQGLRVRGTQLYLDPIGRPQLGFLAHARGARATLPERTIATAPTIALLEAALPRALRKASPLPAAYGQEFALGAPRLSLHPAGHVLGSAQLRCELPTGILAYTADLGGIAERAPATAEKQEPLSCDALVLRATYGHPRYAFPPRAQVLDDLARFVRESLARGATPVVLAAPLGGAQEAILHLREHDIRAHPAIARAAEVYRAQGTALPAVSPLGPVSRGQVVFLPAHPRSRRQLGQLASPRTCLLTGRAVDPGFARQVGVDVALPLSDHAQFADLLEYATRSGARRVQTVHGHAKELASALRERGIVADAIGDPHRQLDLL